MKEFKSTHLLKLKPLAKQNNSANKLMEELSKIALAEFDSEIRFKTLALKGDKKRGLELLGKFDKTFGVKRVLIS